MDFIIDVFLIAMGAANVLVSALVVEFVADKEDATSPLLILFGLSIVNAALMWHGYWQLLLVGAVAGLFVLAII